MSGRSTGKDIGVPNFKKMERKLQNNMNPGRMVENEILEKIVGKGQISELNGFHPLP